jgi:hypothetical protein
MLLLFYFSQLDLNKEIKKKNAIIQFDQTN